MQLHRFLGNEFIKRRLLPPEIYDAKYITTALNTIVNRWPIDEPEVQSKTDPIFILAAGWGSGSTLVQRLVMSSEEVLVWGEPMDLGAPIQRLSSTISPIRKGWPPEMHFNSDKNPRDLSKQWVANLSPSIEIFKQAHRSFFDTWLDQKTNNAPVNRWGLKEVRLTIDHARYLKWLYPNARFLFVYRDLYPCYRGIRRRDWYSVWPRYRATNILRFAHHWQYLVTGFLAGYKDVDGMLIKFEDLVSGQISLQQISDYLDVDTLDAGTLENKLGSRGTGSHPLILPEKIILDSVAGDLRKSLGYR